MAILVRENLCLVRVNVVFFLVWPQGSYLSIIKLWPNIIITAPAPSPARPRCAASRWPAPSAGTYTSPQIPCIFTCPGSGKNLIDLAAVP